MPGERLRKSDLLAALADLVDVDPEEYAGDGVRCHFCLAAEGRLHEESCPWLEAAILCRGDASVARRRVGEDEDEFEERAQEDEFEDEVPFDRKALAAAARDELAAMLGGTRPPTGMDVPTDVADAILDDPLDAPTDFEPEE